MGTSVFLDFGLGSVQTGFNNVAVQVWSDQSQGPLIKLLASLPPNPDLASCYSRWQKIYQYAWPQYKSRKIEVLDEDISNFSMVELNNLSETIQTLINNWFSCSSFHSTVEIPLRQYLVPDEEIQIIVESQDDPFVRRLPFHLWNLIQEFPKADFVLSEREWKIVNPSQTPSGVVRVLAVFGDKAGLQIGEERNILTDLLGAEICFLDEPTSRIFFQTLTQNNWDILFFAGHSISHQDGGKIQLNSDETIQIDHFQEELKIAIDQGLQLAIFNSCDGLGIAKLFEKLNIPHIVVMREYVLDYIAQVFLRQLLVGLSCGLPLHLSLKKARETLDELETFPYASWLPVLIQNPTALPLNWERLCKSKRKVNVPFPTLLTPLPQIDWNSQFSRAIAFANSMNGHDSHLQALRLYNETIASLPPQIDKNIVARLYSYRGAMFKRLNRLKEAQNDLYFARDLATDNYEIEDIAWNLACIYAMNGDKDNLINEISLLAHDPYWRQLILSRYWWFGDFLKDPDIIEILNPA